MDSRPEINPEELNLDEHIQLIVANTYALEQRLVRLKERLGRSDKGRISSICLTDIQKIRALMQTDLL